MFEGFFSPTSKISTAGFDEAASVGQAQIGQHMWGTPMFAGAYCFGGCPKSWLGFLGKSPKNQGHMDDLPGGLSHDKP